MDATQQARLHHDRPPKKEYADAELREMTRAFLASRPGQGFTQNHIEHEFTSDEYLVFFVQAGRVLKALDAERKDILLYKTNDPRRTDWKPDGDKHKFFFYAPARVKLNLAPTQQERDEIVRLEIRQFLFDNPDSSESLIRQAMVALFLHLDILIIRRCLQSLRKTGEVTTKPGTRRAVLHRLKEISC